MHGALIVPHLEVRLAVDDVWRALAVPRDARRNARTARRLEELWPSALSLLQPRGTWSIIAGPEAAMTGMAEPPDQVGIGLCTVGGALEAESARCAAKGLLLDAVLLDAIGSVAAEAAADVVNEMVCHAARSRGLSSARRESPGYGAWDVARQASLLALLPAADLGVTLTDQAMMVPRKSVSFAVRLLTGPAPDEVERCSRCGMTRCRHRRARSPRADGKEAPQEES